MKKIEYKKPKTFHYGWFKFLCKFVSKFIFKLKITKNELKNKKGPYLVIANHESQIDFINLYAAIPTKAHFILSYSFYRISRFRKTMDNIGCIPKQQFQTTVKEMKQMKNVIDNNMPLAIYPVGIMTENGMSTNPSGSVAGLLKFLNTDVYIAKTDGSYLTNPKWSNKRRKGRIYLNIYKVLSKDDVAKLSLEQLYDIMKMHLRYNDYDFVTNNPIKYKRGNNVEGLHYVLHQCPDCNTEYAITSSKDTLTCTKCGYQAKADKYGLLTRVKGSTHYKKPSDWYLDMQSMLSNKIKQNPDYTFNANGKIHMIDDKTSRFKEVGYGTIIMSKEQILLDGKINEETFTQTFNTSSYPLVPFKPGHHIELQKEHDIYRIKFDNPYDCSKFNMVLKEFNNNKN